MEFLLHIIVTLGHTIPLALGYNLIFGKGKIFHFGPVAVSLLIAYAIFIPVSLTGNYALGIVLGLIMCVLASMLFALLAIRLSMDAVGVMTIAMHLAVLALIVNWSDLTRGALGIQRIPSLPFFDTQLLMAVLGVAGVVFWAALFFWIDRNAFGRQIQALAEHQWHAEALGVRRLWVYIAAFCLTGLTSVWDNLLYVSYHHLLHPNDYMFPSFVSYLMFVVAGGSKNARGTLVATFLLVLLREGIRFIPMSPDIVAPVRLILFAIILFAAVWWRRDVLFPKQRSV